MNTTHAGPMRGTPWLEPGARSRAKQLEMLDIDERFWAEWIATMRALVQRELGDEQFTVARMAALKAWERRRKLEQHNLHYKYDPKRRRPGLVGRDVEKQLDKMQARINELGIRRGLIPRPAAEASGVPAGDGAVPAATEPVQPSRKPVQQGPPIRLLVTVNPQTLEMIRTDLPDIDLERATAAEIIDAYALIGTPEEAALFYLGILDGTGA